MAVHGPALPLAEDKFPPDPSIERVHAVADVSSCTFSLLGTSNKPPTKKEVAEALMSYTDMSASERMHFIHNMWHRRPKLATELREALGREDTLARKRQAEAARRYRMAQIRFVGQSALEAAAAADARDAAAAPAPRRQRQQVASADGHPSVPRTASEGANDMLGAAAAAAEPGQPLDDAFDDELKEALADFLASPASEVGGGGDPVNALPAGSGGGVSSSPAAPAPAATSSSPAEAAPAAPSAAAAASNVFWNSAPAVLLPVLGALRLQR